ncbi:MULTISPECIES: tRNA (cytosine(32)/uridine(32)-2'-O)-methyltransferase TrmJ [Aeromonas]|jgi:tRNA (cytidine32/uridine32-2'-O)-methyltransferase|uniref:tRNA (cytidine/uridine-2'-O-)-methyltransferase TrmJ n=1 Tax=Aeromonas encheleia TaxID=73010 RepID=A0AAE9SD91_9GAMM|nr:MULTISPECIES: tRNA (cytosine(32)/uridine(32)-2'-O)-methyltransferase TrmJ [Aeromonas]MBV7414847.1 tRNA (cytosine(32)/uridine(32)-2'-O)-methyltransferase TrmJ [Aeromonas sp. sif2433]MBV7436977.1 tRNA (cytosine(32)/uridine(32)-2'-O)-methyltransferase TrmJ [Aeromonas sp. sif2416]UNP89915.1 tRNA (cytosine(32)/uridine(32)-2'-O)-methyltransferase TrmJ [Aeromonas encheleia]USV59123.1 tRNA (cytosine(32)/uridine(32)-2'-O)-methyltransferase TrmJ [Aeromonas encheleia]
MLDQIRIVLVNTSHTGNMGSAARAMKTMGLTQLVLVDPQALPDDNAIALAAGASDVLVNARIVPTLDDAIADCGLVIGTSARSRTLSWPMLDPREAGEKLVTERVKHPVALVFGRERTGLTNDELQKCHYHVAIPANPEYSSLNLAMAVQTLCYEVRMRWLQDQLPESDEERVDYPSAQQLEGFYLHLEQTLQKTGFITEEHPGHVMSKLRRLFNRARPEVVELNILRGILTSVQKARPQD